MSYDLVVFEKKQTPANASEFLAWHKQKMECEESGNDISCASEKLQKFFHKIREIFPPMNGAFAPDEEALLKDEKLEQYLCDYSIAQDTIYLAFAYSIAPVAYDAVRRAAYFADVGFFAPEEALPIFFDSHYPMLLEGQWFKPVRVSDFNSVKEKLDKMTVKNRSYLYVTDCIGNYVQVGGCKDAFLVEKRIYTDVMEYVHTRAESICAEETEKDSYVMIAGNMVEAKQSQILSKDMAEQLIREFFEKEAALTAGERSLDEAETTGFIKWLKLIL